jgi:CheY-like chemotaxis protein
MHRILIVDDSPIGRLLVSGVLEATGVGDLKTIEAASGEEAWMFLQGQSVDMVITDLYMKDMSGLQLIQKMRKAGFDIPIVAVTMERSPELLAKLSQAGATSVLSKPCSPADLRDALRFVTS